MSMSSSHASDSDDISSVEDNNEEEKAGEPKMTRRDKRVMRKTL